MSTVKYKEIILPEDNFKITRRGSVKNECISFDPDSSPKAWRHYFNVYKQNNLQVFNNECSKMDNLRIAISKYSRLYLTCEINKTKIDIAGDCDFNFNKVKVKRYQSIINKDNKYNDKLNLLNQLEKCSTLHNCLCNFSIMPRTGGLNLFKGKLSQNCDRLDSLIAAFNTYYKYSKTNEFLWINIGIREFLDQFDNIYDYCKKIHFIDSDLTNELIEFGSQPINDCTSLERYMNLAEKVWASKIETWNKFKKIV